MTTMDAATERGLARLRERLPLEARRRGLPAPVRALHRLILRTLAQRGAAPSVPEMQAIAADLPAAVEQLAQQDLIVLDAAGAVVGAYPLTLEPTPHRVTLNGHTVHAMCSVDALSVSALFGVETVIESQCRITGTPIRLRQNGAQVLDITPHRDLRVGIRWQAPGSCAAHSLCREMVFLIDAEAARAWQGDTPELYELFSLDQGIGIGIGFFVPLLAD